MKEIFDTVEEYFKMKPGQQINDHEHEIYINNLIDGNQKIEVLVNKKSLKHFTERRKEDFSKKHTEQKSLEIILLMLNDLPLVIHDSDFKLRHKTIDRRFLIYKKTNNHTTPLCAVLEQKEDRLLLVSYHFIKDRDYQKIINTK